MKQPQTHNSDILGILRKLKIHDPIEVEWVDASTSEVPVIDLPLPTHSVETRQHEIGWFLTMQRGDSWRDLHFVFYTKSLDKDTRTARWRITSLPIALVKRVIPLTRKQALQHVKGHLAAFIMKKSRSHRRHTQHFHDGSVKHVD